MGLQFVSAQLGLHSNLPLFITCDRFDRENWKLKWLLKYILVMEYCAGGDLSQLISKQKELRVKGDRNAYLPHLFVFKVFKQLLNALKHLHSNDKVRFKIFHKLWTIIFIKKKLIFYFRAEFCIVIWNRPMYFLLIIWEMLN